MVCSSANLEPGIFGIFRPVLWLPAGIADRLSDAELEAIVAHELCHARRRDNLAAAIHMVVEAIFWFHPLVWWLGARLTEERERACDEEVVRMGADPQAYAEGILRVCEFYMASPVLCASGVTGGELKKRIEGIMERRFGARLGIGKRVLLAGAAILAVLIPAGIGAFHPLRGAQEQAQRVTFEVASVKPGGPPTPQPSPDGRGMTMRSGCFGGPGSPDPGRYTCQSATLTSIVVSAYELKRYQYAFPSWMNSALFEIAAKVPAGTTKEQFRLMKQNLLTERFKLAAHFEKKEAQVYELVVGKDGPKLKETPSAPEGQADASPIDPSKIRPDADGLLVIPLRRGEMNMTMNGQRTLMRIQGSDQTMEQLASLLGNQINEPVTDATGLKGKYDITITCAPTQSASSRLVVTPGVAESGSAPNDPVVDAAPTIFAAIQQQLGLKLEQKKGTVDFLVIDHVEKTPVEN